MNACRRFVALALVLAGCAPPPKPLPVTKVLPFEDVDTIVPAAEGAVWVAGRKALNQKTRSLWHLTAAGAAELVTEFDDVLTVKSSLDGADVWAIARATDGTKRLWRGGAGVAWTDMKTLPDCYRSADWTIAALGEHQLALLCSAKGTDEPNAGVLMTFEGTKQKTVQTTSNIFRKLLPDGEGGLLALDDKGNILQFGSSGTFLRVPEGTEPPFGPNLEEAKVKLTSYVLAGAARRTFSSPGGLWRLGSPTQPVTLVQWTDKPMEIALTDSAIVGQGAGKEGTLLLAVNAEGPKADKNTVSVMRCGPKGPGESWKSPVRGWMKKVADAFLLVDSGDVRWMLYRGDDTTLLNWALQRHDATGEVTFLSDRGAKADAALWAETAKNEAGAPPLLVSAAILAIVVIGAFALFRRKPAA
jgi:hypothetical protein